MAYRKQVLALYKDLLLAAKAGLPGESSGGMLGQAEAISQIRTSFKANKSLQDSQQIQEQIKSIFCTKVLKFQKHNRVWTFWKCFAHEVLFEKWKGNEV